MKTVTQKARFRQAVINYAEKYGVTKGLTDTMEQDNTFIGGRKEWRNTPVVYGQIS